MSAWSIFTSGTISGRARQNNEENNKQSPTPPLGRAMAYSDAPNKIQIASSTETETDAAASYHQTKVSKAISMNIFFPKFWALLFLI